MFFSSFSRISPLFSMLEKLIFHFYKNGIPRTFALLLKYSEKHERISLFVWSLTSVLFSNMDATEACVITNELFVGNLTSKTRPNLQSHIQLYDDYRSTNYTQYQEQHGFPFLGFCFQQGLLLFFVVHFLNSAEHHLAIETTFSSSSLNAQITSNSAISFGLHNSWIRLNALLMHYP